MEETLEYKLSKAREIFHFNPPISTEEPWMIGLTCLEIYNSTFIIAEENNKFELFRDTFDEFSFEKLRNEI